MDASLVIPSASAQLKQRTTQHEECSTHDQISAGLWSQANEEKEKLFEVMRKVQTKLQRNNSGSEVSEHVDLSQCTWDQVMQQVQTTATQWSTMPKKAPKAAMYIKKLGRNSDAFQSWLQVLPSGDYGSSICGVFALVVNAAGSYTKVEDAIFEALVGIPEIIAGARTYIQVYSQLRDHFLERRTFDLYLSVLRALRQIMLFFADGSFRKIYEPVFKQSSYKADLLEKLEDVKKQAGRIKEEADQCLQRRVMNIDQSLSIQGDLLHDTNQISTKSHQILRGLEQIFLGDAGLQANTVSTTRLTLSSSMVQKEIEGQPNNDRPRKACKRPKEILKLLRYDPSAIDRDVESCITRSRTLDENGMARAAALLQQVRFQEFLAQTTCSAVLLINGNEDLSIVEGLSPLSVVTAKLSKNLDRSESIVVLKYFCGEHKPYKSDPFPATSIGILASLIGQLITHMQDNCATTKFPFLTKSELATLEKMKLSTLCNIFQALMNQLPPKSVLLCVLDELGLYETGSLRNDIETVCRKLTRFAKKQDGIVFKFLVICRGRALGIAQYFGKHVVELNESVEHQDSSAWTVDRLVDQMVLAMAASTDLLEG